MNDKYYIWLVCCLGVANRKNFEILSKYKNIIDFYDDCKSRSVDKSLDLTRKELEVLRKTDVSVADEVLEAYKRFKVKVVTIENRNYPFLLKNISNPPIVLFVVGDISNINNELTLTVVGTRKESLYGKRACEVICSELAVTGFSIVSGLANGGDTTAHVTALKCGAKTYGFLACGLDVNYPSGKSALKNAMVRQGAVITEFLPHTLAEPNNFHIRNRLMSGMSVGTLVIEAPQKSGTKITASYAVEQNRDVFVVPSGIFWKNSIGTAELLKEGAKPVRDAVDILEEYISVYPQKINLEKINSDFSKLVLQNNSLDMSSGSSAKETKAYAQVKKQAKKELVKKGKESIDNVKTIHNTFELDLENDALALEIYKIIKKDAYTVEEISNILGLSYSKVMTSVSKLEMAFIVEKDAENKIVPVKNILE